eukprot:g28120.t1
MTTDWQSRNEGTLVWRAGRKDSLVLQGSGLSSGDRIRIVDGTVDCFDFSQSKQMHSAVATSDGTYLLPSGERYDGDSMMEQLGTARHETTVQNHERWLDIGIMIPGTYQVCWCSAGLGSCDSDEDFTTKVATLAVGGPTAGLIQVFECVTGVACTLPIEGSGLSDNDWIYIQFHTGDRWKWMRNGALNTSGWHEVRGERIRGLKILAPGRRFCLCVALQGCGWQHRPSPSFSTLLQEPYPVFGMQYLIQDSLMKYMKSKENANTDSETLVVEGDGADAQILSPHLARAGRFLLALEAQLAAPASRLRPLEELLPKPWRLGAELLLLELHAAQALRQAPLDGRVGSAFWEHVQQAEGAFRHTDTTGPGASACGVTGAWQFLHRAQLRLQGRDAPMDDLRDPMVNITAYLSEEREGPCGQDMAASLGEAWTFTTATVSTISLWDLLRRFANSSEGFTVDFLSMDIEGNSEDVLEAFFEKRDEELTKHGAKPDATSEMDIFIATLAVEISNDEEQQSWNTSRTGRLLTRHGYELDHRRGLDEYWRHSSVQHCKKAERFRPLGDELGREGAEDHCASYDPISCPSCCSTMQEYTVYAGNLTSGGPLQGQIDRPPIGVPFTYTINGVEGRHSKCSKDCGPENMNLTECNCFPGNFAPDCPGANEELQVQGWFGQLADLNQDHPFVRQKLLDYVKYLVEEYDADAFRLDTAIYMKKDFLKDLQEAAGVDILGETTVNNISYHASFQKAGLSGLLNFPAFYQVHGSFCQYHLGGDLGNYHLQGAFTPALPDLRKLASVMQFQNPEVYPNLDLLGNFADNHDEFARIGYYCDADSYRIKNALALMMFARGIPIVYYGTEQGLDGHQANVLEKDAMRKQGVEDKGEIWVFINNNQNWTGQSPFLYCPAPSEHEAWYDVFSEERKGCFMADNAEPKVLVRRVRMPAVYAVERISEQVWILWVFIFLLVASNVLLLAYAQRLFHKLHSVEAGRTLVCSSISVTDQDFFQQAGQVTVMGLNGKDDYHKCYLRGTCDVHLRGTGLDAQDALMLVDPMDNCGQAGLPVDFSVDGSQFYTASRDRIFVGTFTAETSEGLEGWIFNLGTPVRTGRYRMCYCSRTRALSGMCQERIDFDQPAGELFVRGSEFNAELRCEQGEMCQITARGAQWDALDRMVLLKAGTNHSCGMINGGQYPAWSSALTPTTLQPDVATLDHLRAIQGGKELGGAHCVESGVTNYQGFQHELGTVRVTGSILAVRQVGITPGHWKPKLPAAPFAVSVEVDALTTFMLLGRPMEDVELLSDRQKFFPRCWGSGTTVESVIEMGPNVVHIPTYVPELTLDAATHFHVWCYPRDGCSNGRCVMPSNNVGLMVDIAPEDFERQVMESGLKDDERMQGVVSQLMAAEDFLTFRDMMLKHHMQMQQAAEGTYHGPSGMTPEEEKLANDAAIAAAIAADASTMEEQASAVARGAHSAPSAASAPPPPPASAEEERAFGAAGGAYGRAVYGGQKKPASNEKAAAIRKALFNGLKR